MSCGERTIPATIDEIAKTTPDQKWATYAESRECFERGQLRTVTFAELANAIDRLAWYFDEALSSRQNKETVGYIGPNDIRYFILACAACKCGLKVSLHTTLYEEAQAKTGRLSFRRREIPWRPTFLCSRRLNAAHC